MAAFVILCRVALADAPGPAEMVLELSVNGQRSPDAFIVLIDPDQRVWLERADFARLRLRPPPVTPRLSDGREYLPVDALPGASVRLDAASSMAFLDVPAVAFQSSQQSLAPRRTPPRAQSAPGAFLNYEAYGERGDYAGADAVGGWAELGLFGPPGVLTGTLIAADVDGARKFARLDTTYTHDFPAALRTLRIGDAISDGGAWGRAVRFGGLQWGTNFATRPDLVTTPLLAASGAAVVPSSVDVFVNGQPIGTTQVPAGPFVIDRLPAITGSGDVRLVVNDALGRQQVITLPFYSSPALLAPGLARYSLELGAIRRNYGERSNDYGSLLASATYRVGLSTRFTAELHGEALRGDAHAAGADLAFALGRIGVLSASAAAGGSASSDGWLGAIGFEHAGRRFSFTWRTQAASSGFRELGDTDGTSHPRLRQLVQTGFTLGRAGNLSLAVVHDAYFGAPSHRVYSVAHGIGIGHGYLNFNLSVVDGAGRDRSAWLGYTLPLSGGRSAGIWVRQDTTLPPPDTELAAQLMRNPPPGVGYGYRLSASSAGNYDAGWTQQFEPLAIELAAARYAEVSAQRLSLTGGATWLGGELRASRAVDDSFALVDAGGIGGLTVYVDNQPVTHTDASGRALLRHLRPYEANRVSIDATELPIDASLATQSIEVVPAWRSGAVVRLPVARERGGMLRLVRAGGAPVPAGAVVQFKGASFPVGLDGRTYLTGYDHGLAGEAHWDGGRCLFRVPPPPPDDPLPDLGDVPCRAPGH